MEFNLDAAINGSPIERKDGLCVRFGVYDKNAQCAMDYL